jgi:hypothetical protein
MNSKTPMVVLICLAALCGALAATAAEPSAAATASMPPVPSWVPDPAQREGLRRSLTLLASSTPENRHKVRVLFYGQSITQQGWWEDVAGYLRRTYPHADLVVENRAIGGHSSQLLVKTAEADLYPFQPDLLIFHVYGSHIDYETIIRRVRERTCADIVLQTDHITRDASLAEPTDPASLTPKQWDPWMNHVFLPSTAAKYGACRADIHNLWKDYLRAHQMAASNLLSDAVHLNARGSWLMAQLLNAYLAPLPAKPGYQPLDNPRVRTKLLRVEPSAQEATVEFRGTRVDLLFRRDARNSVEVTLDGQKPSARGELYGFSRVSAFPQSDWPLLLKVGAQAPLVAERWTLRLSEVSADGKVCRFALSGSVTGEDGAGVSTNRFVSRSGRVVIEPGDWNLAYCVSVYKRPLAENWTVAWDAALRGADSAVKPATAPGAESVVTLACGLAPGPHTLVLRGASLWTDAAAVRIYDPAAP